MKIEKWKLQNERKRTGLSHWAVLAFLIVFVLVLLIVSNYFLFPAFAASASATPEEKARLAAYSRLLLMVVLFVLFIALILIFRVSRFFFPTKAAPRTKTTYIDAWAESGKRTAAEQTQDDDEDEESTSR